MAAANTKDMTHGVPWRLIAGFAIPIFLSQLFQQLYNTADSLIVSNFLGDNALAAVSASGPLIFLLISFFAGAASGVGVAISRYFGAGDYDKVSRAVHTAVLLGLISSLILTVIGVLFTPTLLRWMDTDPEVLPDAIAYFRCYFAGVGAGVMYNTFTGIMNALGDSKRPLFFLLVASFLNIGLDLACIIVFDMGVFGAAFATVFSQGVAGVGSLLYILRHYHELRWSKDEGAFSLPHCAKLCSMGIPMGLQCSITAIGSVVLQGAVNGLGSDIVAAQTAGSKAAQFLCVPLESIGTAMTTYASQNMGAHDLKRVDRGLYTALGIGCVYSIASFIILRFADKLLIGLFLDAGEVEIMANAQSFIFWNSVFYIPLAVLIIYRYTIQGLGYSGLAMFAGVAEMVARAMVGFWFVPLWGYFAACIASPVAWFFACFFLIPAYIVVRKRLQNEKQADAQQAARA